MALIVKFFAKFLLKRIWQTFSIVFCFIFKISRKIFCKIKELSYTNFYRNLVTWFVWSMALIVKLFAKFLLKRIWQTFSIVFCFIFKITRKIFCKIKELFQWKLTDLTVRNIFFTDESVKINWFNSEKANHWFNQWKFDWFRFREYVRLFFDL